MKTETLFTNTKSFIVGTKLFNSKLPVVTSIYIDLVSIKESLDWKYCDIDWLWPKLNPFTQHIISKAPLKKSKKRILVDVKFQTLSPSITSCIPGWHLDGAESDIHHLFLCGSEGGTEFIGEKVKIPDSVDKNSYNKYISDDVKVWTAPMNRFVTFSGMDFHRGVATQKETERILIRLTETDTIKPHNKSFKPWSGARQ